MNKKPNRACPKCKELGKDSSNNHLFLMKDGITWTCLRDNHPKYFEVDGEEVLEKVSMKTEKHKQLGEILTLPSTIIEDRKLNKATSDFFGIRVGYDESTGAACEHYYPGYTNGILISFKCRKLPKTFFWVNPGAKDLFGQKQFPAGGKRILIAGGELDSSSAWQMLNKEYSNMQVACVSPMHGENMADIKVNKEYIGSFQQIYLATDMDATGRKLAQDCVKLFGPDKVFIMELPEKDVSDCLTKGREKEFIMAFFSASKYKPSGIVSVDEIVDLAVTPVEWGLDYPYSSLTSITYGLRTPAVIAIGAGPGAGKTSVIQQIQQHLVYKHNQKVGIFSLEEPPAFTLKKLIGAIMHKPIHLPDIKYDIKEAKQIANTLKDYVYLFDDSEYQGWEDIVAAIRYFCQEGVRYFFIDPVSALHEHLDPSEANTFIGVMMRDLRRLAKTFDITFFHVNHLNNAPGSKDHGAGGKVYGGQFAGSRSQWRFSTDVWGLERNQLAEEEEERNTVNMVIIKNRLSGVTGRFPLVYNRAKGILEEKHLFG